MPSRLVRLAQQMLSPTASAAEQPPLRGYPYMVQQQKARLTTGGLTLGASRPLEWFTLNDVVMGGRSESSCESDDRGGLVFRGVVSTVGGGFCSCRTTSAQEFSCSPLDPQLCVHALSLSLSLSLSDSLSLSVCVCVCVCVCLTFDRG